MYLICEILLVCFKCILQAFTLLWESLMSTSVLTNGLKHLIRSKSDTEKLVKKPSGAEEIEVAMEEVINSKTGM